MDHNKFSDTTKAERSKLLGLINGKKVNYDNNGRRGLSASDEKEGRRLHHDTSTLEDRPVLYGADIVGPVQDQG